VLALLRQRRWVGFTLLAVFFVLLFVRLSFWQVSRLHERQRANDLVRAHLAAAPMTMSELTALAGSDRAFATDQQWRTVRVTGHWDASHQVLVRNRPSDSGDNGYEVVTPLLPDAGGPAVLVDRGWVPTGSTPAAPESVPAPQTGEVTVVGHLQPSEPSRPTDGLPAGQVTSLSTADLSKGDGYPVVDGYLLLVSESPAPSSAPAVHAAPVLDDGPHLSYAVQWVLFAAVAIGGWWTFLRREAEEAAETPTTEPQQEPEPDPEPERAETPNAS
jgi:cytochrome oxidase assembly protein ShyY1